MSYQLLAQRRRCRSIASICERINQNPHNEDAWRELFGPYLAHRICVLVVKSRIDFYSNKRTYRREYLAYVL